MPKCDASVRRAKRIAKRIFYRDISLFPCCLFALFIYFPSRRTDAAALEDSTVAEEDEDEVEEVAEEEREEDFGKGGLRREVR